jgi:hypothetical protein
MKKVHLDFFIILNQCTLDYLKSSIIVNTKHSVN